VSFRGIMFSAVRGIMSTRGRGPVDMSVWIYPRHRGTPMLYSMLVTCATLFLLILVLAAPRTPEAHRLARLVRAQEK
jgi:hypothetical protein